MLFHFFLYNSLLFYTRSILAFLTLTSNSKEGFYHDDNKDFKKKIDCGFEHVWPEITLVGQINYLKYLMTYGF